MFKEVVGDYTNPLGGGHRILIDFEGKHGVYYDKRLAKRYPKAESEYNLWYRSQKESASNRPRFGVSFTQEIMVQSDLSIYQVLIDMEVPEASALNKSFEFVGNKAFDTKSSIHVPNSINTNITHTEYKMVSNYMKDLMKELWIKRGLNVYIYEEKK